MPESRNEVSEETGKKKIQWSFHKKIAKDYWDGS